MIEKIRDYLNGLPEEQRQGAIAEIKRLLFEYSDKKHNPVDNVVWVNYNQVEANNYNPNAVAKQEMKLLYTSIKHDGYTQPIVTIFDPEKNKYVIVDGFIGMDIIRQTSLTIYKDGRIEFRALPEQGHRLEMLADPCGLIKLKISCNDYVSAYLVDTGAKYAYGREYLFSGGKPFGHIKDYNPRLGHFESDIYHIYVDFGPIQKTLDIGDSVEVRDDLKATMSLIVGNITDLFNEICVIDMQNRVVTLK